jgi:hypothetical protein
MSPDSIPSTPIQQPLSAISPDDLANLVAPIALYPDALLGQVLVASTYPLEVVEAQQWLQQNRNLPNRELLQAAQQQNWDPSVQALVAFPDVLALLNQNIRWTADLGNAFLAQQSDVMNAVQTLRARARQNGQLQSTPQLSVNTETQGDRSAIEIQPVNPQIVYVPYYNPSVVWGAPAEGYYPALPYAGSGFGSLFGTIANLAGFLPGFQGLLGLRSWGWALSWLAHALFVNNSFFNDFGFHNFNGGSFNSGYGGSSLWVHNPNHRLGVPYGSSAVASRYGGAGERGRGEPGRGESGRGVRPARPFGYGWRSFGSDTRRPSAESSARAFSQPSRTQPSRTIGRTNDSGLQPNRSAGRDPYLGNSAQNRDRSFTGERSFASSHDSFANRSPSRVPEPARTAKSSPWGHLPHFWKARMSSNGSSSQHALSQHGFSQHAPKQKHFSERKFKAPKFKAPHAPKSHGGGHASRGHSGSKSHRG